MRTLASASVVSVLCGVSVWLFVAPQLVSSGMVEPGPLIGLMVVIPTPIGLIAALAGAVAGIVLLVRRRRQAGVGALLMTLGQFVTVGLGVWIVVWAFGFGTTGWELIALPSSLLVGQLVVGAGLLTTVVTGRRRLRARRAAVEQ
ncbi:hypothetical protein LCL87_21225 [Rhodococcus hoagii]|nr:hypothetical protein [Prescottella equi]